MQWAEAEAVRKLHIATQSWTYMDESSGDQDTGTKVLTEEEDLWRDIHPLNFLGHYWETASSDTGDEDDNYKS